MSVQAARSTFVAGVARDAAVADGRGDLKSLLQFCRRLGKFKPSVLPVLHDDQVVPFADAEAQAEAVQVHFMRLMRDTVLAEGARVPTAGLVLDTLLPHPSLGEMVLLALHEDEKREGVRTGLAASRLVRGVPSYAS